MIYNLQVGGYATEQFAVHNLQFRGGWACGCFKHFNRVCDQFTVAHLQSGIPRSHGQQQST